MINGLSDRLKDLRYKYNFSQKEVAKRIGVSPSIISGYETGERVPSVEILLALSHLYKCSTDYLLGKTSDTSSISLDTTGLTPNQINALLVLISTMKKNE